MGVGGQRHAPAASSPGKDPVPIVQEAGWASGLVWTGAGNLASRFADRPARSESLYRLSYPGLEKYSGIKFNENWSSGSRVPRGQTDRHDEATSCFSQFLRTALWVTSHVLEKSVR